MASPEGWAANPELVLEFYNQRRRAVRAAAPNAAHKTLVDLEQAYDVRIVTQNVDDLHERAGSRHVLHLHGEIMLASSTRDRRLIRHLGHADILLGDRCELGSQLRPHVAWFGEMVPAMDEAVDLVADADVLLVVGTSLQVDPTAGLVYEAPKRGLAGSWSTRTSPKKSLGQRSRSSPSPRPSACRRSWPISRHRPRPNTNPT